VSAKKISHALLSPAPPVGQRESERRDGGEPEREPKRRRGTRGACESVRQACAFRYVTSPCFFLCLSSSSSHVYNLLLRDVMRLFSSLISVKFNSCPKACVAMCVREAFARRAFLSFCPERAFTARKNFLFHSNCFVVLLSGEVTKYRKKCRMKSSDVRANTLCGAYVTLLRLIGTKQGNSSLRQ